MTRRRAWVGADPGGKNNFGIAILTADGIARTACVDSAHDAMSWIADQRVGAPAGIGVDAPLWWSSGASGERKVDKLLRKRYGLSGGQVQCANSLRGAALVQGAMLVQRAREAWPGIVVTETHPKALLRALGLKGAGFNRRFAVSLAIRNPKALEHERDAVISAVCAREAETGRWNTDLAQDRLPTEQDPSSYWLGPVRYAWPEALVQA